MLTTSAAATAVIDTQQVSGVKLRMLIDGICVDEVFYANARGYKNRYEASSSALQRFLRLKLRYYTGSIVLTTVTANPLPTISILAGMAG